MKAPFREIVREIGRKGGKIGGKRCRSNGRRALRRRQWWQRSNEGLRGWRGSVRRRAAGVRVGKGSRLRMTDLERSLAEFARRGPSQIRCAKVSPAERKTNPRAAIGIANAFLCVISLLAFAKVGVAMV
jgi:hypothetical protein